MLPTEKADAVKRAPYLSIVAGALALMGTVVGFIWTLNANSARQTELKIRDVEARTGLADLTSDLKQQQTDLAAAEKRLAESLAAQRAQVQDLTTRSSAGTPAQLSATVAKQLTDVSSATAKLSIQYDTMTDQQGQLDKRLKEMETVILADPTKALSLPLLQRDLQAVSQQLDRGLASAKADSDRVYDLMKWVLGLMGIVSLSLVGTAVGSVFKKEPSKEGGARVADDTNRSEGSTGTSN
jgi:hypothetical protein